MTNDSTASSLRADKKNKTMKSPRLSSLMFVRQFARVYINMEIIEHTPVIAN